MSASGSSPLEGPRKTAQYLRRFDLLLARFFDLSLDLMVVAGFDGYFKTVNPAWSLFLGYTEEELLARPYVEFVHPDDREHTAVQAGGLSGGREVKSFENRYVAKDGSYRWLSWRAIPSVEDELIYAIARDVTEQRQHTQLERARTAVTRVIATSSDWHAAMEDVLQAICIQFDWWVGELWEPTEGGLRRTRSWTAPAASGAVALVQSGIRTLGHGEGLAGGALLAGEPVVHPDLSRATAFIHAEEARAAGLRGAVAVPLATVASKRAVICFLTPNASPIEQGVAALFSDLGLQLGEFAQRLDAEESRRRAVELRQAALEFRATHDPLTGLANRDLLVDRIGTALRQARRSGSGLAVMMVDLDNFKALNDANGHEYGDNVLKEVAARLVATVRDSDTVARIGGDEFAILAVGDDVEGAARLAAKLCAASRAAVAATIEGAAPLAWSIGVAVFPDHGTDTPALLRSADRAMYAAKRAASGWAVFDPAIHLP
ncbi:MAG: hypothetical protein NVS3B18_04230 [Candidatus Dormibacteria bacterium]